MRFAIFTLTSVYKICPMAVLFRLSEMALKKNKMFILCKTDIVRDIIAALVSKLGKETIQMGL